MSDDFYKALSASLKEGETIVVGTVTRLVDGSDPERPVIYFLPETDVRHLELEGHRLGSGELRSEHDGGNSSGQRIPKQFDLKRVAFSTDGPQIGAKVAFVHLDKTR